MKIQNAIVFYSAIGMVFATISLIVLYFKPMRKLLLGFSKKYKIGDGPFFNFVFWVIFFLISAILVDAIWTYLSMKSALQLSSKDMFVDNFDKIQKHDHQNYIILFREYREYYMAERNFMLTASCLFIMFVFNSFFSSFKKLYEVEIKHQAKLKTL